MIKDLLTRKFHLPILDLDLCIFFIQIRTQLMVEEYHSLCFQYVALEIIFFRKYRWMFRLYSPLHHKAVPKNRMERRANIELRREVHSVRSQNRLLFEKLKKYEREIEVLQEQLRSLRSENTEEPHQEEAEGAEG